MVVWATGPAGKWANLRIEFFSRVRGLFHPLQLPARQAHANFTATTKVDATKETKFVYPGPKVRPFRATVRVKY